MTLKLSWVSEPNDSPRFHLGPDRRFVDEIGRRLGVVVPLLEGRLVDVVPDHGWVLLNSWDPLQALAACRKEEFARLARRVIPIDINTSRIYQDLLETAALPAAVDSWSQLAWRNDGDAAIATKGFFGLRRIAAVLGADCKDGSDNYTYLTSRTHQGLPHLLADYLLALDAEAESPAGRR